MRKNKKIFLLILISFFLLPCVFGAQVNTPVAAFSDVIWVEEKYSTAQETTDAASLGSIEVDQTVARSFQENITETIQGGHQMLQFSSVSNSASFTRHIMCKNHTRYLNGSSWVYDPIDPTTIFRPSDTKAECLTTVSIDDTIEFRWHYRSNSSKTWISCYNWSDSPGPGEYHYVGYLSIARYWPGHHYPRAYKVDVYLDGSFSFSEFFEVTNGGLNSPRICEDVDVNGNPVNITSRFTIGVDTKAHHYLRFDKIAYFNEELGCCHNFTALWIQPDGSTYKTYSGSFPDYKDTDVTWNYWESNYTQDDYISINPSTPVGNWKVEVYLDRYYFNNTWIRYGPITTTPFIVGNETVADWTFMVYLDADNTLENASIPIFEYIASVGSSSQVNIVVQWDRMPGQDSRYGNWTDCKRFNVTKDMDPTPENAALNLSEVNMGDPNTLKDFVNWTINNYPANYYFLVLWDHGTGCMGVCFDTTNVTDFLSLPELSQALSGLPAIMDVVLLDACSMSMTEVAYQIKDYANVLVGPEGLGYAPAPYHYYLSSLTSNPSMSPSAFAREVVTYYINWCKSESQIKNATISATDLTKITSFTAAIDDFALKLKENENFYNYLINLARNQTEGYQGPLEGQTGYYIDLYHFAQLTNQYVLDEELQNTADQVMTTLESIIIIEDDKFRPDSHGLSIFFPDEEDKYNYFKSVYEETTFAEDTPWDEFVKYYLDIQEFGYVLTVQTPYQYISVKVDDESYTTDNERKLQVFILPGLYTVNVPTTVSTEPGSRGVFTQWSDGRTENPRALDINGKLTLEAEYKTQYYLTVNTDPSGLTPQPNVSPLGPWYDDSKQVTCTAQEISGYVFYNWTVDGASRGLGINPITVTMDGPHEATAHYIEPAPSSIPPLTTSLNKIEKGKSITVSGYITPAHEGVTVTLTYKRPDGSTLNRTVISLSGGTFSDTYTPDDAGTWSVTASWPGDDDHYGATSPAVSFGVTTKAWWENLFRPEMLQVILGLVGIAFTVTFVGAAWVTTRRSARAKRAAEERAAVAEEKVEKKKYELVYRDLLKEYPRIQRRECRVAIAQIGVSKTGDILSEFYDEKATGLFGLRKDKVETVRAKVKNMIEIAHAKEVNILLFPELTVDLNYDQLLEDVASLAKAYEMYIIPGSYHHQETKRNISVVIGPDGILWEQEKHIPATIHYKGKRIKEAIDVGTIPRKTIVCNTEFGRIAIAICRDFLDMDLRVELKNFEPPVDIVFNPAFTPVTADFKAVHFDARRSIYAYCFFANVAEFGDSLIYTPEKERIERKIPSGEESLIYKDVDLFKLRTERKKWEKEREKEKRFIQSTR